MIEYFYLTHRWDPIEYYQSMADLSGPGSTPHSPKFQELSFTIRCNLVPYRGHLFRGGSYHSAKIRSECCILTLDRAVNHRCTGVNKRRKQVGVMKKYRQVELVEDRKARVRASLQTEGCGPQRPPVEQLQPRCGRSAAVVNRKSWVNIAVCPCLYSSLIHNRNINPLENKVWDTYLYKKKCVPFVIMFDYVSAYIYICICMWLYNKSPQEPQLTGLTKCWQIK